MPKNVKEAVRWFTKEAADQGDVVARPWVPGQGWAGRVSVSELQGGDPVIYESSGSKRCRCAVWPWVPVKGWAESASELQRVGAMIHESSGPRRCIRAVQPQRYLCEWKEVEVGGIQDVKTSLI